MARVICGGITDATTSYQPAISYVFLPLASGRSLSFLLLISGSKRQRSSPSRKMIGASILGQPNTAPIDASHQSHGRAQSACPQQHPGLSCHGGKHTREIVSCAAHLVSGGIRRRSPTPCVQGCTMAAPATHRRSACISSQREVDRTTQPHRGDWTRRRASRSCTTARRFACNPSAMGPRVRA